MLTNGCYGYFRDEFYYLAASDHLALGYVDFAPLMAWFTHASRFVFGDSLHAIRLLPAVAFGAEVLLTGFHLHGRARHQANSDGNPDARPLAAILRGRIRWPEMVETVAGVYNSLPPEERAKTAILAHHGGA